MRVEEKGTAFGFIGCIMHWWYEKQADILICEIMKSWSYDRAYPSLTDCSFTCNACIIFSDLFTQSNFDHSYTADGVAIYYMDDPLTPKLSPPSL